MFSKEPLNERANQLLDALNSAGDWVSIEQLSSHIGDIKDGDADLMMLMAGQGVIEARKAGENGYEYHSQGQNQVPDLG
jgi:hypothetical protein